MLGQLFTFDLCTGAGDNIEFMPDDLTSPSPAPEPMDFLRSNAEANDSAASLPADTVLHRANHCECTYTIVWCVSKYA